MRGLYESTSTHRAGTSETRALSLFDRGIYELTTSSTWLLETPWNRRLLRSSSRRTNPSGRMVMPSSSAPWRSANVSFFESCNARRQHHGRKVYARRATRSLESVESKSWIDPLAACFPDAGKPWNHTDNNTWTMAFGDSVTTMRREARSDQPLAGG